MQQMLQDFFKAVRSHDITISAAESIEASRTAELIGFDDREILKLALSVTLAKSVDEKARFNDCFDEFFTFNSFQQGEESASSASPAKAPANESQPPGQSAEEQVASHYEGKSELVKMVMERNRVALANEMKRAARSVGVTDIWLFTQKGIYTQKILKEMGMQEINQEIAELANTTCPRGKAQAALLRQVRKLLLEEVRSFVEQQLSLYGSGTSKRLREEFLMNTRLSNIERRDFHRMHEIVRRLAKKLSDTHAKKRKQTQRGVLDFRKTMRRNVAYDGVMFETYWKTKNLERPRIVCICDVSGSVSAYARFLLLFLYSLNDVLMQIDSFAFSSHLVDVNDIFKEHPVEQAIELALKEAGGGSTDYGQMLRDLKQNRIENSDNLRNIDHRSTVIILGDARNNYGEPRLDVMKLIYQRAKRVIWLNPEPQISWNTGDSVIGKYRPFCHLVKEANTIKQLEGLVDNILKHSLAG
ncbi:MAG: VWA domain-containing protein [Pseudomonadales bacterium]|nr:VWA domain-containing protein [Pseudomonadales bacterium]MCP5333108.1 VWA domain-containing protein [Pseudomonadales bacterium]